MEGVAGVVKPIVTTDERGRGFVEVEIDGGASRWLAYTATQRRERGQGDGTDVMFMMYKYPKGSKHYTASAWFKVNGQTIEPWDADIQLGTMLIADVLWRAWLDSA